jgi:hypothetical protein
MQSKIAHWSDAYLADATLRLSCAALVARVLWERHGVKVNWPSATGMSMIDGASVTAELALGAATHCLDPFDGCGVLMRARGVSAAHIGVGCVIGGEVLVLHALAAAGADGMVLRQSVRTLARLNLPVEGFYRFNALALAARVAA